MIVQQLRTSAAIRFTANSCSVTSVSVCASRTAAARRSSCGARYHTMYSAVVMGREHRNQTCCEDDISAWANCFGGSAHLLQLCDNALEAPRGSCIRPSLALATSQVHFQVLTQPHCTRLQHSDSVSTN